MPLLQFSDIQQSILLGLTGIWACFLFGGFIFGKLNDERTRRMPTRTRMMSSLILVIIAWILFAFLRDTTYVVLALPVAIGMSFGFLGDLFMAQLLPIKDYVLGGIASFGIGHIAYIIGLLSASEDFQLSDSAIQWSAWGIWLVITVILWYLIVYRGSEKTLLHKVALPYALLLASTTGFATGLALQHPAFILITIGAGLFLLSDLILATELFNGARWTYIGDVVWLTYGPGQMLIVMGLALYFII